MKKAFIIMALTTGTFCVGNSLASMQERRADAMQSDQSYSSQTGMIGNMSREEFDRINAQGNAAVAAIMPTSAPLSKNDQKLMMEVAMGGMMQLEMSRVAVQRATNEEARILAQSEVEEQTGVSAKLSEIASAKGMPMPMAMNSKVQSMVAKMQGMSGADFDRFYVRESGVKGHEKLEKTMTKVQSKASDPAMTNLAAATMPVIRMHQQVSRAVLNKMSGKGNMMSGNSMNMNSNMMMNSNMGGNMNSNSMMNSNMNRNMNSNMNRNMNSNGNMNRNMNSNGNMNRP